MGWGGEEVERTGQLLGRVTDRRVCIRAWRTVSRAGYDQWG